MATNYPGSLDTSTQQPSPSASTEMDDSGFEHDVVHANHSGAIIAVETKVGTGASTPVANSVLGGTGSGTSAWTTTPTLGGLTVSGDVAVDTNVLYVDTTNNRVGIGNYPATTLDVQGTINQPWGNAFTQDGVANTKFIDVNFTGGLGNHVDLSVPNNGSAGLGDTVMRLVDGGNVGIGTNSPLYRLHVNSGTTNTVAEFESTDTVAYIAVSDSDTSSGTQVALGAVGDALRLRAGNSNHLAITSSGNVGIGTTSPSTKLDVNGSLSKSSGSFRIPHPLPAKADTHDLVHSFVEAPQADNLYRGRADLTDGAATVDLDAAAGMTTGTFPLLNRDVECFIVNNDGWTAVRGSVSGSTLTIEAQDATCADTVDWLVVGERHDQHMFDTEWTDDNGRVIVEPVRPPAPEDELENA